MIPSPRKPVFFTADWHLFHASSLVFDRRPFTDLSHMHEGLIKNYNAMVPPEGVCYFLGDMGLSKNTNIAKVIARLNGTKVLVLGNHDKGPNAMYALGFDVVVFGLTLYIAQKRVSLTHCPLLGIPREDTSGMRTCNGTENWHKEQKNRRFSTEDHGQYHLHGHIHSRKGKKISKKFEGKQFDVGVPANGFRPVSISQVESWIIKYERTGEIK